MTTALTVYGTNVAATTLSTAGLLVTTAGGTLSSCSSKLGTATGFGQIYALSNSNAWPALGSIPNPSGTAGGFLLDSNVLNGQTIGAGTWTPEIRVRVSNGTATADFFMPVWKYNSSSGVFTFLWQPNSFSNSLTTAFSFPTFNNPSESAVSFSPGDFLYYEVWADVTANSTGTSAATLIMTVCSDTGNADNSLITPGYDPTSVTSSSSVLQSWWWPQVGAAITSGVQQPPPPPTKLTGGWIWPGDSGAGAAYTSIQPKLSFIIAQYMTVLNDGTLQENDDGNTSTGTIAQSNNAGINGWNATNLASIKQYSTYQFCDVSAVFRANGGTADSGGAAKLVNSSSLSTSFINQAIAFLNFTGMTGLELDWERTGNTSMTAGTYTNYLSFLTTLGNTLHSHGYKLIVSVNAYDSASGGTNPESAYRLKYADLNSLPIDYILPLIYDNEFNTSEAGYSQASTTYITNSCNYILSKITDYTRIIAGLSAKGYSDVSTDLGVWNLGPTDNLTLSQLQAVSGYPGTRNSSSQEMQFTPNGVYYDYNDTTTLDSHRTTVYNTGVLHVSVWYIGSGFWF